MAKLLNVGINVFCEKPKTYGDLISDVIVAQKNRSASEYCATLKNEIHMVGLMRYLCGECVSLNVRGIFTDPNYEILCTIQMEFENGTIGMLAAD